jgi:dihydroorotate dehydrogenase electron transfer subunit
MDRGQFISIVRANQPLCREHFRLVLVLPEFPATEPGQFVQLSCRDMDLDYAAGEVSEWCEGSKLELTGSELSTRQAYLRRPFSIAGRRDLSDGVELEFIHRVVGAGTDWLSHLTVGDRVHLLGPLGNKFPLPPGQRLAILVGGGVGIPPMLYLAEKFAGRSAVAFCGALSRELLPLTVNEDAPIPGMDSVEPLMGITEFSRHGIPSVISTDDGSYGFRGFVTQALEQYLDVMQEQGGRGTEGQRDGGTKGRRERGTQEERGRGTGGREEEAVSAEDSRASSPVPLSLRPSVPLSRCPIIYTCGPEPMMKRVAEIAADRGLECQVAVERAMACGMGTCQSCCIRVRKPDAAAPPLAGSEWCWRLACTDGPIFRGADLLW